MTLASTPADRLAAAPGSARTLTARPGLGPLDVLVLSAWCGLAAGLLEVGTRILCRGIDPHDRLYMMSRHFVWLAPLANLLLFSAMGLFLATVDEALASVGRVALPEADRLLCRAA